VQATPIHIKEANAFIAKYHRHNLPTVGGKFAVGAIHRGKLAGVAVAGRPVARRLDGGKTIEVLRVCTDGTPNCCSFLYSRVAKIARLFGYTKVITYTLEEESGDSLRAVGGRVARRVRAREWSAPSRRRKSQAVCGEKKLRWEL
jgi:hypothetical protein